MSEETQVTEATSPMEQPAEAPKRRSRARKVADDGPQEVGPAVQEVIQQVQERAAENERQPGEEAPKRTWAEKTQSATDTVANMRFTGNHKRYRVEITFGDGKPSDEVRQALKDNGFRWDSQDKAWTLPVRYNSRAEDRTHAQRTFEEIVGMVREERGMPRGQAVPF